jgi:hypothetical protein
VINIQQYPFTSLPLRGDHATNMKIQCTLLMICATVVRSRAHTELSDLDCLGQRDGNSSTVIGFHLRPSCHRKNDARNEGSKSNESESNIFYSLLFGAKVDDKVIQSEVLPNSVSQQLSSPTSVSNHDNSYVPHMLDNYSTLVAKPQSMESDRLYNQSSDNANATYETESLEEYSKLVLNPQSGVLDTVYNRLHDKALKGKSDTFDGIGNRFNESDKSSPMASTLESYSTLFSRAKKGDYDYDYSQDRYDEYSKTSYVGPTLEGYSSLISKLNLNESDSTQYEPDNGVREAYKAYINNISSTQKTTADNELMNITTTNITDSTTSWLNYLETPAIKWSTPLPDNSILGQGNAVMQSPLDDEVLYVTTAQGRVYMLNRTSGVLNNKTSFIASPKDQISVVSSQSKLTFSEFGLYLVFSYVETNLFDNSSTSYIVALTPLLDVLWTSSVPGIIEGTPVISRASTPEKNNTNYTNSSDDDGVIICTHNIYLDGDIKAGSSTLMFVKNGEFAWQIQAPNNAFQGANMSYTAPVSVRRGDDDLVMWQSEIAGGSTNTSTIVTLQVVMDGDNVADQYKLEIKLYTVNDNAATVTPAFDKEGSTFFFGLSGSRVTARTLADDNNLLWTTTQVRAGISGLDSIQASPVLSEDGSRLFVVLSDGSLVRLNTKDGSVQWNESLRVEVTNPPVVISDGVMVVVVADNGEISSYHQETGEMHWDHVCLFGDNNCLDSTIRAGYSVSHGDLMLYLGANLMGRVVAIQLKEPTKQQNSNPHQWS